VKDKRVLEVLKCIYTRIKYKIILARYNVSLWHITGNYYCRPYKRQVINIIDSLSVNNVIEIGCGLGEIISRINCSGVKVGLDQDKDIIKAGSFLNKNVIFIRDISELEEVETSFDFMILINCISALSHAQLLELIRKVEAIGPEKILVDIVKKECTGFSFYHDIADFSNKYEVVNEIECIDHVRSIYLLEKK
jgi:SAM-dependent methyltransferase